MSLPTPQLITNARRASQPLANRETPLIYNEWYVAAFDHEVGRHLLARRLLDRRIVMYRTLEGEPVALEDRCAHRSFPLSKSWLEGNDIICGYHGFRYDEAGDLKEVPSQKNCPRGIGVRRYPLVCKGLLIWIWLGDPALADATSIPHQQWIDDPDWACTSGYFHHPGNYVSLHENLMDLTHLSFLHANTIGTPDYASAPYKLDLKEVHYTLIREVVQTTLSPVWGKTTGLGECNTAARITTSESLSHALHRVSVSFYDSAAPVDKLEHFHIRTAHILTPETANTLHYFIVHGRDFAKQDAALGDFMHEQLFAAFNEDVEGMGALEAVMGDVDDQHYEISVASDAPAVAMRMYLKKRAEAERQI